MGELHRERGGLDATGAIAEQGTGCVVGGKVEKLRRELQAFARENPFLFVDGRGPSDDADMAELEQLRLDIEDHERRHPCIDVSDLLARYDEREERLYQERCEKRRLRARNKRAKLLAKFGLPCWLFGSEPDDPGAVSDPSCLDEQNESDTEADHDCPGSSMSLEQVKEIGERSMEQYCDYFGKYCELYELYSEDDSQEFPVAPLEAFPVTSTRCIQKSGNCFHKNYRLHEESETATNLRYREPEKMMQIFSLKLSKIQTHPITIYGCFAVRDEMEPLRNYVFNRSRDNAFTIEPGCNSLPLCSPRRGIYAIDVVLLEVDIKIKQEGDGSADEPLVSGYFELSGAIHDTDCRLYGRIHGDRYCLDMDYVFVRESVAATVEVSATVSNPSCLTFTACTSKYSDKKMVLFDEIFSGAKRLFRHIMAVKMGSELELCLQLKVNGSSHSCSWSFQPGVYSKVGTDKILPQGYGDFCVKVFWSVR